MLTTLTWPGVGVLLLIACIIGAVSVALQGRGQTAFAVASLVALIGAVGGPWLARQFNIIEAINLRVDDQPFPLISAVVGGALAVILLNLISGRRLLRN